MEMWNDECGVRNKYKKPEDLYSELITLNYCLAPGVSPGCARKGFFPSIERSLKFP